MATIHDVCKLAGVSHATVTRVLRSSEGVRPVTREKVLTAVRELGYRPSAIAQSLGSKESGLIGLMLPSFMSAFFGPVMTQIQTTARKAGKKLMVAQGDSDFYERETIEHFISMRCDNLVLYSRYLSDRELIELAPYMPEFRLLDRYIEALSDKCIYFDHTAAAFMATEYLIQKGHKVIGCVAGNTRHYNAHCRLLGYQKAMEQYGLSTTSDLVFIGERYDSMEGYKGFKKLWSQRADMTGLYVCSEDMASGCLNAVRESGIKIPDDLAMVSYDSHHLCSSFYPRLTTVDFPICKMSGAAIQQMIDGEKVDQNPVKYSTRIYERDSV